MPQVWSSWTCVGTTRSIVRHAVVAPKLCEVVLDEAHRLQAVVVGAGVHVRPGGVAVVDEQRLAAFAEDDVEVGARPAAAPEQVRRELDEALLREECGSGGVSVFQPATPSSAPESRQSIERAGEPVESLGDVRDRLAVRRQDRSTRWSRSAWPATRW